MSGRYCAIFLIFTVFASVANSNDDRWVINTPKDKNEGNLRIRLIRATSNRLYIEALCNPSCEGITWHLKRFSFYSWQSLPPPEVRKLENGQYMLQGLYSIFEYIVEARIPGSEHSIRARTCPDHLGPLRDLHSRFNGPGWLNIRWKPYSSYECYQQIQYTTRYKVKGGNFSEERVYGFYPIDDKGTLYAGPSHPCDDWPNYFCLLITENVQAGKIHIVEITPKRIGGTDSDVGMLQTIEAYADPHNLQGSPDSGVHPDCQMWAWLAVGSCLFCIAIIIGILVSALVTTFRKIDAYEKEHGLPEGPVDFMAMLYNL